MIELALFGMLKGEYQPQGTVSIKSPKTMIDEVGLIVNSNDFRWSI